MSEIVRIDEFREGPSRHSPNLRYEIRVGEDWVQWVGWSIPVLLNDAVIHTDRNGWRYATPILDEEETLEPVYASIEVTAPPRIVEYRTIIRASREALDADINVLLPEWQPYRDQQSHGSLVWQVMVRYGVEA